VHRKLRQAAVEAVLQVYEGQSHAHYLFDDSAPETREAFSEISSFFNKHMGKQRHRSFEHPVSGDAVSGRSWPCAASQSVFGGGQNGAK